VREYGLQLDRSLTRAGVKLRALDYGSLQHEVSRLEPGSVLLIHFEPALMPPPVLGRQLEVARACGARVVLCCHWYDRDLCDQFAGAVDRFVLHRDYSPRHDHSVTIPLGCPVYDPSGKDRGAIRARWGLPQDKVVMSTIGFLAGWKRLPELTARLLDAMAPHEQLYLYVHAPWPFDDGFARAHDPEIRRVLESHACKRAKLSTEFVPEGDALDIAWASDLGLCYHPIHTRSVSAATKQFVATRRPAVVTSSLHSSDIEYGVLRVASFEPADFAQAAVQVACNASWREALGSQMQAEYDRMNMDAVAKKYLALFEELLKR